MNLDGTDRGVKRGFVTGDCCLVGYRNEGVIVGIEWGRLVGFFIGLGCDVFFVWMGCGGWERGYWMWDFGSGGKGRG